MKSLFENHVKIPEQIGIVGSENLPESEFSTIPLSTVEFPVNILVEKVSEKLINRIEGDTSEPVFLEIAPKLKCRQSSQLAGIYKFSLEGGMKEGIC